MDYPFKKQTLDSENSVQQQHNAIIESFVLLIRPLKNNAILSVTDGRIPTASFAKATNIAKLLPCKEPVSVDK